MAASGRAERPRYGFATRDDRVPLDATRPRRARRGTCRHARVDRVSRRRRCLQAEARGPLRLSGLLDARAPPGHVQRRAGVEPAYRAADIRPASSPVTRDASGALAIDGRGTAVDWLLVMRRFDQSQLLDRLATAGALPWQLMAPLGQAIARMHQGAERCAARGGAASMAWVVDGNARDFATRPALDAGVAGEVTARARALLAAHGGRLDERQARGLVRRCHGDLHLRNIVLLDGVPTPFDAVEFNDDISCIDVLYDLSFLLMESLAPVAASACQRRVQCVHRRHRRRRRITPAAVVPGVPRRGAGQNRRHHGGARNRRRQAARARARCRRLSDARAAVAGSAAAASDRHRWRVRDGQVDVGAQPRAGNGGGAGRAARAQRRGSQTAGRCSDALAARARVLHGRRLRAGVHGRRRQRAAGRGRRPLGDRGRRLCARPSATPSKRSPGERAFRSSASGSMRPAAVCIERVESRHGDASDAGAEVVRAQVVRDSGVVQWRRLNAAGPPEHTMRAARSLVGLSSD